MKVSQAVFTEGGKGPAGFGNVDSQGGQGGPDQTGDRDIVEADDGHVFRDAQARILKGQHRADGHVVIAGEDRVGAKLALRQLHARGMTG